jgi:sulfite exporter TauE/SafE
MLAFGLATFPVMFAVSIFGNWIASIMRSRYQFLTKIVIFIISILLIYRGTMGLLPILKTSTHKPAVMECH